MEDKFYIEDMIELGELPSFDFSTEQYRLVSLFKKSENKPFFGFFDFFKNRKPSLQTS